MPDTSIAGSDHGKKVTFSSPVVRSGSVSSTPHLVSQPVSFDMCGILIQKHQGRLQTVMQRGRPNVGTRLGPTPYHQKIIRMRQDASIAMHILQFVAEEF